MKQVYDNRLSSSTSSALIKNDILISDPLEKARLFNSFFVSQSKLDGAENIPPSVEPFQTSAYISADIVASKQDVYNLLTNVDTSKACGHDGVENKIIQICCKGLSDHLQALLISLFFLESFLFSGNLQMLFLYLKKIIVI